MAALSVKAQSSFSLKGKVVDDSTDLPVEGAFIVCQNTTIGTTSGSDGTFSIQIPSGGHTLVIGSTGYENDSRRLSASGGQSEFLLVRIKKKAKQMEEVVVQASLEVTNGWEKYGEHFRHYFLGRSPNASGCTIENPEILKFYFSKKKNRLKVKAESPVIIRNDSLGYKILYRLDSFVYEYQTQFSIHSGVTSFSEIEGTEEQKQQWKKNREDAYWGSRLHFMRSYYDRSLQDDGFVIEEVVKKENTERFIPLSAPYDSAVYQMIDSAETEVVLIGRYRINYKEAPMHRSYLIANKFPLTAKGQLSTVEMKNGFVVLSNGYFYEQNEVISSGYWAWQNLADQLPYDYWPEDQ